MSQQREVRCAAFELRAADSGSSKKITGMAAAFGKKTMLRPGINEVIARGAFSRSIANGDDVIACFNHDEQKIFARVSAGTLQLRESAAGLLFDATVDTGISYVSDLYRNIKAGNVAECSFAFYVDSEDGDTIDADPSERGAMLRTLRSVRLLDVSPVVHPAYGGNVTNVSARNVIDSTLEQRSAAVRANLSSLMEVSERTVAAMQAHLELAKRK